MSEADSTIDRLEGQSAWYSERSSSNQRAYKGLKLLQIVIAAAIPVLASAAARLDVLIGALGACIVILEGVQHLYQFQRNWTTYRSTCEALKHEKFLYLADAGPYAGVADPHALLGERVESICTEEQARWVAARRRLPAAEGSQG